MIVIKKRKHKMDDIEWWRNLPLNRIVEIVPKEKSRTIWVDSVYDIIPQIQSSGAINEAEKIKE